MTVYFDASALVKVLLEEEDWRDGQALWSFATRRLSSTLAYAETLAAVGAAERSGRIDGPARRAANAQLGEMWADLESISLDDRLASDAGDLAQLRGLRGGDAVHLAAASAVDDPDLILATWDGDLAAAANAAGVDVFPAA